jgi:autotransporter-associated beta strand protein
MKNNILNTLRNYKFAIATFTALLLVGWSSESSAQVLYSTAGSSYGQDFNTLATTGGSLTWANNSTLTGWSLFSTASSSTPVTTIAIDNGTSNSGGFYSFGSTSSTERALGGQGSGTFYGSSITSGNVAGYIAVNLRNTTGSSLSKITVGFDGEQWANGGNTTAQSMVMEYGFGSSFSGVSTWTAAPTAFNWSSPVVSASGTSRVVLDGNASANRVAGVGGTITLASAWANLADLWIRWIERNDSGNDHALAIDNFSFSAAASGAANLVWNLTTAGTWNTTATNWTAGSGSVAYANGDNATFSNTAGGTITLSGTLTPGSVTVSAASGTYTFTGATASDKISGTTSLAKSGAGLLAVTSANDYSGGTTITGGTVQIGNAGALGSGTITLNGSGATLQNSSGSLLTVLNALTIGTSGGTFNAGSAGTTLSGALTHGGILTKSGAGNLTLGGTITSNAGAGFNVSEGDLTIGQASGIVKVFGNSTLTGNLVLANGIRFDVDGGATISGTGKIKVVTTGTLISSTSGDTGGTISSEIVLNSGNTAVTPGSWNNGVYTGSTFSTTIGATKGATTSLLNTLTVGVISGNADVDISNNSSTGGGGGKTILNGVSTYTGNTTINANAPDVAGTANIVLGVDNAISSTSGLIVGTKTGLGLPVLDMNGKNQAVAYLADGANVSGTTKNLTIRNDANATATSTLTLGNNNVTGSMGFSGVISGAGINLVKEGAYTQTLSGANTYAGTTTVNAGTLAVNGSLLNSGSVVVNQNGFLGGSGSVGAISGAGTVGPGNSPGILTAKSVDPTAGMDFKFEITSANPVYTSATSSGNDLLHLTSNSSPFNGGTFGAGNIVSIYLNSSTITTSLLNGTNTSFSGAFFVDGTYGLASALSPASFAYYTTSALLGTAGSSSVDYNGVSYYLLDSTIAAKTTLTDTAVASAGFSTGTVAGTVLTFNAVPEPSAQSLLAFGMAALVAVRSLRRGRGNS